MGFEIIMALVSIITKKAFKGKKKRQNKFKLSHDLM